MSNETPGSLSTCLSTGAPTKLTAPALGKVIEARTYRARLGRARNRPRPHNECVNGVDSSNSCTVNETPDPSAGADKLVEGRTKKESGTKIELNARDHKILNLCYEHQFIEHGLIARELFQGRRTATSRRLRKLNEAGLLRPEPLSGDPARRIIYRLTPLGRRYAEERTESIVSDQRRLNPDILTHDIFVTEARLRLEACWDGIWTPEHSLKTDEYREIPDGVFTFPSGLRVAVEIENSLKGKDRYLKLFESWKNVRPFFVLYIATDTRILDYLKRYLAFAPKEVAFALTDIESLRREDKNVWTPVGLKALFGRRTY